MKKLGIWTAITGGIVIALLGIVIIMSVSLFSNSGLLSNEPREQLISGSTVHIAESGSRSIYLETSGRLPSLHNYDFAFINIATSERINSRSSFISSSYHIGNTNGRCMADVDLIVGSYIIEFEPWHGGDYFVWGDGMVINAIGNIFCHYWSCWILVASPHNFHSLACFLYYWQKESGKEGGLA